MRLTPRKHFDPLSHVETDLFFYTFYTFSLVLFSLFFDFIFYALFLGNKLLLLIISYKLISKWKSKRECITKNIQRWSVITNISWWPGHTSWGCCFWTWLPASVLSACCCTRAFGFPAWSLCADVSPRLLSVQVCCCTWPVGWGWWKVGGTLAWCSQLGEIMVFYFVTNYKILL